MLEQRKRRFSIFFPKYFLDETLCMKKWWMKTRWKNGFDSRFLKLTSSKILVFEASWLKRKEITRQIFYILIVPEILCFRWFFWQAKKNSWVEIAIWFFSIVWIFNFNWRIMIFNNQSHIVYCARWSEVNPVHILKREFSSL